MTKPARIAACALALALLPAAVSAQRIDADPLDSARDLARAREDSTRTPLRELLTTRAETAWFYADWRFGNLRVGRGTLSLVLDGLDRAAEAGLEAAESPADRLAALSRRWETARAVEAINRARYEAGRIAFQDLAQTEFARLDAEVRLADALAGTEPAAVFGPPPQSLSYDVGPLDFARERGRALAELRRADPRELRRQRRDAARREVEARFTEFRVGRGTLDGNLDALARRAEAELALAETPAERLAALARLWEATRAGETISQARYEAGRIAVQDLAETRVARLNAEIRLVEALASTQATPASGWSAANEFIGLDPLDAARELARAVEAVEGLRRADLPQLRRQRRDTAAQEAEARLREFHFGRGTLDVMLKSIRNLADAELALANTRQERIAARERLWQTALHIEAVNQSRFDAGRVAITDLLQTRLTRLTAEIQLRRELAGP
jgi:hypothetical protein